MSKIKEEFQRIKEKYARHRRELTAAGVALALTAGVSYTARDFLNENENSKNKTEKTKTTKSTTDTQEDISVYQITGQDLQR